MLIILINLILLCIDFGILLFEPVIKLSTITIKFSGFSANFSAKQLSILMEIIIYKVVMYTLSSGYPDLIIGAIVFIIVARGAYRILQLAK